MSRCKAEADLTMMKVEKIEHNQLHLQNEASFAEVGVVESNAKERR